MTAPIKMAKRAAAGTLALAVCFTGGMLGAGAAQAANGFKFDQRLGGADRFETAVNASKQAFDNAGDVIVVQDDALADGLTASYLAGVKQAPILYVRQNEVPAVTAAEITRLGAERVFIVGGSAVVSNGVQASLSSSGRTVTRIGGTDRFDTAAKVATSDSNDVDTVFIANGDAPADALAAGPIAYKSNNPILLTRSDSVPSQTAAALNQLNEDNRIVLGGNAVVSTSTYSDLGATSRLRGPDRQGTAVAIADYATANEGFTKANAALVGSEDRNTADALIAAPILGQTGTPILFTTRGGLGTTSKTYLTDNVGELTGIGYVFGGNAAVPQSVADEATEAAGGTAPPPVTPPPSTSSIAVAETTPSTQILRADSGEQTARDDNRVYEASGLSAGKEYRITLVDSANIRVNGNEVTFLSSSDTLATSKFSADVGVNYANIVTVNGAATGATGLDVPGAAGPPAVAGTNVRTFTAVPVDGKISFEIDGTGIGSVTPVVYLNGGPGRTQADGGLSPRLETTATDVGQFAPAAEPFGLGGTARYTSPIAANGAIAGNPVIVAVDKANNSFSTATGRYTYDDNDTFRVNGAPVSIAAFNAQLSSGDTIDSDGPNDGTDGTDDSTFSNDTSANSILNLVDGNPDTPTGVTATRSSSTSTSVTVTGVVTGPIRDVDQLVIQRAPVSNSGPTTVGGFTTIATISAVDTDPSTPATVQFRYVDQNVPAGNYQYRVAAINDDDQGVYSAASTTVPVSADAPTVVDTRLATNTAGPFDLNAGDSFTIVSSGDLAAPGNTAALRLMDTDGTVADITNNGTQSTFVLNTQPVEINGTTYPAGRVLTVSIVTAPTVVEAGDTAGLGLPTTITNQSGITNQGGARLQLTGDVIIEDAG